MRRLLGMCENGLARHPARPELVEGLTFPFGAQFKDEASTSSA